MKEIHETVVRNTDCLPSTSEISQTGRDRERTRCNDLVVKSVDEVEEKTSRQRLITTPNIIKKKELEKTR